ncbi:sigma-70 family RNA polymerase sigma factor [Brevibacillus sp. M2.1A]|uniref:RNA polymerase sigma factor n=1 Tax=Brevibacillus TaxID=55080 RepID=UPI00156B3AC4|nr:MULTISPECIES: sigma-70 family RNA polymerase sigma factor [Brevibacillus]MBY0086500.1 sigma-70 family RNA polymerase sigma factor [Brevibacillus brevis]MCC8437679.1 sigma-70 family RNA polymerase sigma factor [Brevibacillus sp. M2.1A]MCE0452913.1 sigma-70 family RNA polymerase sigma factor [Brevibacillus sp. AF8]UKK99802.1 sigma-70 family RNA polymerase sigma factor [Brevibacillus brevis]
MNLREQVLLAKQGDREAFIAVVKQVESSLYHTAKSILKKEEDIADALQETILKAYKSLHSLREPQFFKTWMFRILINECNKIVANRSRNVLVDEFPTQLSLSPKDEHIDLRDAVERLDEQQRLVIVLHYFEDMPLRQVAEVLEISESAAKMRLSRARNNLMEKLTTFREGKIHYGSI